MSKPLALIFVPGIALGACAQQQATTPLAKLSSPTLEIIANQQLAVVLHVDDSGGCPVLGDDARALFDGQPMQMTHGGYDTNSSGCFPIGFWFESAPTTALAGYERQNDSSQLVVVDSSAQWGIDTSRLFANDFVIDTEHSQIVWSDVAQITSAQIAPGTALGIHGNTISFAPGTTPIWVDATAHPVPTRCDGPDQCTVNLEGTRTWSGTNP